MIRFLSLLAVSMMIFCAPLSAQETDNFVLLEPAAEEEQPVKDITVEDYEERLELAEAMHEIWPVREKIENSLERVAERLPQADRIKFKAAMRKNIEFEALENASIEAMAEVFTAKELTVMIDFYGSKEGRSVSHKTEDYEKLLQPELIKILDKAILDSKLGSQ